MAFDEAERNQPEGVLGSKGDIAGSQQSLKHEDTPISLVRYLESRYNAVTTLLVRIIPSIA